MANSEVFSFVCSECKQRNYSKMKNRKAKVEKISLSKFCRFCRKHTSHKESKA